MPTSPPQEGCSPLYYASFKNHVPVAEALIKHGAKVDLARDVSQCYFKCILLFFIINHVIFFLHVHLHVWSKKITMKQNVQSVPFHFSRKSVNVYIIHLDLCVFSNVLKKNAAYLYKFIISHVVR